MSRFALFLSLLAALAPAAPIGAQGPPLGATFFEDFESTAVGELPPGWTFYQEGGTLPDAHWFVFDDFGRKIAYSGAEPGDGAPDEDWLITPQITPAAGDFLIFDATQGFFKDFGDRFYVLLSTTTPDAPDAFTDTLAAYTEDEFPLGYQTLQLDLAAYAGVPLYVAFVHVSTAPNPDEWRLDNVWVRPVQPAAVLDAALVFQDASPPGPPLPVEGSNRQSIVTANVRVVGDEGTVEVTELSFTAEGTTDPDHIATARLFYTGATPFLAFPDPNNVVFGSIQDPGVALTFTGSQALPPGDNYFWLVYAIDPALEPTYPYPQADATFVGAVVDGVTHDATVTTLDGALDIVLAPAPNDSLAHAAPLAPEPARYGSTTLSATDELDLGEPGASCAEGGFFDGRNSVWWHFMAPSDGLITVDLTPSEFNTVLVLLDPDLNELACNDDIEPFVTVQSRIEDFPVTAGQEVYVRVTGWGLPTLGEAGVVGLDFTFASTVAGEGALPLVYGLSAPYPNPTDGRTSLDLVLRDPGDVVIEVYDLLGRRVLQQAVGPAAADTPRTLTLDTAALPAATYLVRVRAGATVETRRLTVAR